VEDTSTCWYYSREVLDEGVIDPRDTRDILTMCLSVIYSGGVQSGSTFGISRY